MDKKIVDVAHFAGVSAATVSRVLNESNQVKPKTKLKVKAIEELGYLPNASAKNLRSQKTMTIGVVVPDINAAYFAQIIKGIENSAFANKYRVFICDGQNTKEKELEATTLLINRTVDGLILVQSALSDEELIEMSEKGFNIGIVGRNVESEGIPCIYTDNVKFAREVVNHLCDQGHRSIAFLSGFPDAVDSYDRLEGYLEGMKARGLLLQTELLECGNFNEDEGYQAFLRLMGKNIGFTAVFAANDEMALGVYKACRELNIDIPSQMAVVGVDNNRIGQYIAPTLSTVNQPLYTMGALIAEKLIDQMNQNVYGDKRTFLIDSELIIRQSSNYIRPQSGSGREDQEVNL